MPPTPWTAKTSQASSYLYFVNFLKSTEKKQQIAPKKKLKILISQKNSIAKIN